MRNSLRKSLYLRGAAALCCLVLVVGCGEKARKGPKTFAAKGVVLVSGKPAEGALIVLHPLDATLDLRPSAQADKKGEFKLTSFQPGDGAPAGEYKVAVIWPEAQPGSTPTQPVGQITSMGGDSEAKRPPRDQLEGRYANSETSGLKCVIKDQPENVLQTFDLK